ncbi:site-specific integrase [uncultured Corynebacterium sp.]|uniref:tyrosine-type recombinase/integrase n=1 Tax=uncultured Corynebacterium sp. TaxID=159447 RepID=UPI00259B56A1|nr:site-specific integrase [uncultured Corynebacterium sp.]
MAAKKRRTRSAWGSAEKLPSGRWRAKYTGPDAKQHKAPATFPTELMARAWLAEERRLIDLNAWTPPARRKEAAQYASRTVGQWMDDYHEILELRTDAPRASTMQNYRDIARNRITAPVAPGDTEPGVIALRGVPLRELTKQHVYDWWDGLRRAYPDTPQRNQHAYSRLKAAMDEAVRRELIDKNPVDIREGAKRVKPASMYLPTDAELNTLIEHAPARYRAITALMLHHGLRIGEAVALAVEDVEVDYTPPVPYVGPYLPRVTVHVRRNAQRLKIDGRIQMVVQPPKTAAGQREVPIMAVDVPLVLHHLTNYAAAQPTTVRAAEGQVELRLFTTTSTGQMVMDTSYRSVLQRVEDAHGIPRDIKPHSGRRWLITRLAEQGAHLKEIGRLLGQDDMDTITKVYMLVRAERTGALMEKVNATLTVPGAPGDWTKDGEYVQEA